MALNPDWKEFLRLLESCGVEFIVVGAWARAFHGEPRMTGDIDFWIRRSPENAEKLLRVVREFGFGSLGLTLSDFLADDIVIQLGYPPRRIDIITKLTGLSFEEGWRDKVPGTLDDVGVYYLSKEHFIRNKRATGRAKDLADVEAIE